MCVKLLQSCLYVCVCGGVCVCEAASVVSVGRVCVCVCVCARVKPLQLCLILCDPLDCSPPGSSVHDIL